eukprot:6214694-Pleurochrysis_carterae.AAC.3
MMLLTSRYAHKHAQRKSQQLTKLDTCECDDSAHEHASVLIQCVCDNTRRCTDVTSFEIKSTPRRPVHLTAKCDWRVKQGSVRGKRCNPPPRQFGCYYLDSHNLGQLPVQREPFLPHLIEWSTLVTIPPAWLMLVFVSSSSRNGSSRVYTPVPQRALRLYGYPLVSGNASAAISLTDQQQLRVVLRQSALRFIWSGASRPKSDTRSEQCGVQPLPPFT